MNEHDFFKAITDGNDTVEEKVIAILVARGFLIHKDSEGFYLSDNSATDDMIYLADGLEEYSLGMIEDLLIKQDTERGRILFKGKPRVIINANAKVVDAISFFTKQRRVKFPVCNCKRTWSRFAYREHGEKVPVKDLEAYISYYVKAISACGVYTNYSCDGNHLHGGKVVVGSDYPFSFWHHLIWEHCIKTALPFIEDGIPFSTEDQFSVYYEINKIADWLYKNRFLLRNIKKDATHKISKNKLRRMDEKELEALFSNACDFSTIPYYEVKNVRL